MEQRVRERAYAIWVEEGCPDGQDGDHWLRAESEIAALLRTAPPTIEVDTEETAVAVAEDAPAPVRKTRARKAPAQTARAEAGAAAAKPPAKPRARRKAEPAT
ncbi:DUF2934 domain-containing protein [Azospirillum halopraeferens]|uniref:DUF2934 domain-containing protein n=1 Tax=Azospirillum halopraeferens TaxID=34010 RepID=UPI0004132427|nr:DUF2934 domain-containing protein [Azospirillum halopraeferens]